VGAASSPQGVGELNAGLGYCFVSGDVYARLVSRTGPCGEDAAPTIVRLPGDCLHAIGMSARSCDVGGFRVVAVPGGMERESQWWVTSSRVGSGTGTMRKRPHGASPLGIARGLPPRDRHVRPKLRRRRIPRGGCTREYGVRMSAVGHVVARRIGYRHFAKSARRASPLRFEEHMKGCHELHEATTDKRRPTSQEAAQEKSLFA
jgi:hypothetical protein